MPDGLGLQIRGGPLPVILRGRLAIQAYGYLATMLNGQNSLATLLRCCPADISEIAVLQTLFLLHQKGLLSESREAVVARIPSTDSVLSRQLLFWGRHTALTGSANSAAELQQRLAISRVVLIGNGLFAAATADLLIRTGIGKTDILPWRDEDLLQQCIDEGTLPGRITVFPSSQSVDDILSSLRALAVGADLVITATRNAPSALFRGINSMSIDQGWSWLRSNDDGNQIEIGPLVQPYRSACYTCFELRQTSVIGHAIEESLFQKHLECAPQPERRFLFGESIPGASFSAGLVAMEVVRALTFIAPPICINATVSWSLLKGESSTHRLLRVPRCPDCYPGQRFPLVG